ncbi:hypothetical protein B0T18DRAFT_190022 [Schizothecium vesticola]|uniref:Uncharacterized protein n=1 Tax=Schizothecium vesticola TaxID=314040 RepID=A0AA40K2P8_9PEZI|nr:hypothetical protein B0T18DRAFT_190022 [Schizothecium vesticola]
MWVCVCVCLPVRERDDKKQERLAVGILCPGSDLWKFRFLPAGLPFCVQNSLDLPATDDGGNHGFIASLNSVVPLTIWIPVSGMASVLRLDRALEPPNPDMSDNVKSEASVNRTHQIQQYNFLPTHPPALTSACYPEPSAVSRACKTCGPPRGRIENPSPATTQLHASRIWTLGVATGPVGGIQGPCMPTRYQNAVYRRECR